MAPVDTQRLRIALQPPQAVTVTDAILWSPRSVSRRPGLVLAHGAGSDLTDPVLRAVGRALAERGVPVMAFAFGYAAAGRRRPDPMPRLEATYRDAVAEARRRVGDRPLVLGGRSLGGRVASRLIADGEPADGLCCLGYPLHPAGQPERLRTDHFERIAVPTLLISGDRDRLCDLELLQREITRLPQLPRVHVVAGADHAFAVRKRDGRDATEILAEVVDVADRWLDTLQAADRDHGGVPA